MLQLSLFVKELRENRLQFLLLAAVFAAAALAVPLLHGPAAGDLSAVDLSLYTGGRQPVLIAGAYSNFAWSLWIAGYQSILSAAAAVLLGAGAVSGEFARGTALFLAAKPVTRREIYTTKAAAGLALLASLLIGSTLLLVLVSSLKGYLVDFGPFMLAALITLAGAAVIYLGTAALSVLFTGLLKTLLAAAPAWFLLCAPAYLDTPAASLSILYLMQAIPYWLLGQNPIVPLGLCLVMGGALYELGNWLFTNREL